MTYSSLGALVSPEAGGAAEEGVLEAVGVFAQPTEDASKSKDKRIAEIRFFIVFSLLKNNMYHNAAALRITDIYPLMEPIKMPLAKYFCKNG